MNEEYLLVYVFDYGVLGVAIEQPYGADVIFPIEDLRYQRQLETDEYQVIGLVSELDPTFLED